MRNALKQKIVIIGAGPAGLTAGYKLAAEGHDVVCLEAHSAVGGMCRSLDLWGQRVDLGPHRFFSTNPVINEFWHSISQGRFSLVDRQSRILYSGKLFRYPLKAIEVFSKAGIANSAAFFLSYVKSKFQTAKPRTLEEWVIRRFGRRLYLAFFKNYSEKLWGIPCSQIDQAWAAQRIRGLSLGGIVAGFLRGKTPMRRTLVEQFFYPDGGTGEFYKQLAAQMREFGGRIEFNAKVSEVMTDGKKVTAVRTSDGRDFAADAVISTMPLPLLLNALDDVPAEVRGAAARLRFRNTILVYVEVDRKEVFTDNWIYVHSPDVQHGRITNFRNWGPTLSCGRDNTILCVEFWAFDADPLWKFDSARLGDLAKQELDQIGILPPGTNCLRTEVIKLHKSYPVYEAGYQTSLKTIENFVDSIENLFAIGRGGAFKYNNQDHSILMGLLLAREIARGSARGLWHVNTDEDYQERGPVYEAAEA